MLYLSREAGRDLNADPPGRSKQMHGRDFAENRKGVAMNLQTLFVFGVAAIAGAAFAAEPQAAGEGLVAVQSRNLDELYLRPNADLAAYRKVLIDPVRAEMRGDWVKNLNYTRNVSRWVRPDDAQRIAADAASSLESDVAQGFKARG